MRYNRSWIVSFSPQIPQIQIKTTNTSYNGTISWTPSGIFNGIRPSSQGDHRLKNIPHPEPDSTIRTTSTKNLKNKTAHKFCINNLSQSDSHWIISPTLTTTGMRRILYGMSEKKTYHIFKRILLQTTYSFSYLVLLLFSFSVFYISISDPYQL